jgi:hypothetical protein
MDLSAEQALIYAQEIIAERGYLVIGTTPGSGVYKLGTVLKKIWDTDVPYPFVVAAYTDFNDLGITA